MAQDTVLTLGILGGTGKEGSGLALRWAWRPAVLNAPAAVPARGLLASAIGCLMVISPLGILFGFPSLTVIAAIELLGLLVLVALWYTGRRAAPAKGQP